MLKIMLFLCYSHTPSDLLATAPEHVRATSEENWLHSNTSPKLLRCNISRSDVAAAEPARGQRGSQPAPPVEALQIDMYGHFKCLHLYVSRNCVTVSHTTCLGKVPCYGVLGPWI